MSKFYYGVALGTGITLSIGYFLNDGAKRQCQIDHAVERCVSRFSYVPAAGGDHNARRTGNDEHG